MITFYSNRLIPKLPYIRWKSIYETYTYTWVKHIFKSFYATFLHSNLDFNPAQGWCLWLARGMGWNPPPLSLFRRILFQTHQNAHLHSPGHFQSPSEIPMTVSKKLRPWWTSKVDHLRKMSNFPKFHLVSLKISIFTPNKRVCNWIVCTIIRHLTTFCQY